jgi:hypothetical protein
MRNRLRIAGAALTAGLAVTAGLTAAQPAYAHHQPVTLTNYGSGLCATSTGNYNGAPVVQSACTSSTAQQWSRVNLGNGYLMLQSVASTSTYPYTPLCLDVTDGRIDNRVPLHVWACTITPGMNWRLVYAGHIGYRPYYTVQTKLGNRCMDVPAGSLVDGEQLQTYSCSAGLTNPAQLWSGKPNPDY